MPTTITAEPSASVVGPPRRPIIGPDTRPPTANGTEKATNTTPVSSSDRPRITSSAVGTSTITTPEPQFDSVASAVPSRKEARPVTLRVTSGSSGRRRWYTAARNPAPTSTGTIVPQASQPPDDACWIPLTTPAVPSITSTRRSTGRVRVRSAGSGGTSTTSITNPKPEQHHVDAEEHPPRPHVGDHAGDQRARRAADAAQRAPDPHRDRLARSREQRVDGRQRRGEAARARHALQRAPGHHQREGVGDRAEERRHREPDHAAEEQRTGAHPVGDPTDEQQWRGEREARHGDDGPRGGGAHSEVVADGRQQHDHAVHVDRQHEHRHAERAQRQPLLDHARRLTTAGSRQQTERDRGAVLLLDGERAAQRGGTSQAPSASS